MSEIPEFKFALREDLKNKPEFLPIKIEPLASGWDVSCAIPGGIIIQAGQYVRIPLGFRAFPPSGYWFELKPRSSSHAKKHLNCLYGTVDESWEGEVQLSCQYLPDSLEISNLLRFDNGLKGSLSIEFGERIGQIIPVKRLEIRTSQITNEEYDRLCWERASSRGTGGFGSTG